MKRILLAIVSIDITSVTDEAAIMQKAIASRIATLTLGLMTAGYALAGDMLDDGNPNFNIGVPPAGFGTYSPATQESTPSARRSAGPLSAQENTRQHLRVERLQAGTGKFEGGNNTPCIGTTGFGSSAVIPGHKC